MMNEYSNEVNELLNGIYNSFDKAKLDPFLRVFQNDPMLYQYYHKRLFEIIKECMENEKGKQINILMNENILLKEQINELNSKINYTISENQKEINNQIRLLKTQENEKV